MSKPNDAAVRVRNLIAQDAANIMRRLERRLSTMLSDFSRLRDRQVLLGVLKSWFESARFDELAHLSPAEQAATSGFYESLDELREYFKYTQDMPKTAEQVLRVHYIELQKAHEHLLEVIGPALDPREDTDEIDLQTAPLNGTPKPST